MKLFISSCRALLALALVVAVGPRAAAQLVSGEVFIQGSYVETALANNGAFGSVNAAPSGYHTRSGSEPLSGRLGFVSDPNKDGWTVGTPVFFGDYFLPDELVASQEGWRIQINGGTPSTCWRGTGGVTTSVDVTGSNTAYSSVGSVKTGTWQGAIGNLKIKQVTTLNTSQLFMVVNVTLTNTGSTTLSNVYYERVVNPDNEYMVTKPSPTGTGEYRTNNKIEFKLPNTKNKTLVSGTGATYGAYMGLGSNDCRAKGFMCNGLVPSLTPAQAYAETSPYTYSVTSIALADFAIGVVYQLGNIAAGDSTTLAFAYILKAADLDTAFAQIQHSFINNTTNYQSKDTLRICPGSTTLAINNPGGYSWEWSPATGLSSTTAPTVTVTVDTTPITYRAIGTNLTSGCGSLGKDTIYLNVKPHALPKNVHINPAAITLCSGDTARLAGRFTASSGLGFLWSTTATDSVINTTTAGNYIFKVTTSNGCSASDTAIVTVNARPVAPVVADVEYCQGATAAALGVTPLTGTHLSWYADSVGGSGSATAFIPTTTTVGTQTYYVSQVNNITGCEGARARITVTIKALPAMPTVAADTVAYCLNATATALSATGTSLKWYTDPTTGSGSTTAPIPATGTAGFTTYYVTQTNGTTLCESLRKPIVVRIKALPALPVVVSPVAYCAGATATALSATGTHLSWYADSVGGAASATAPIPSAGTAGVTYFYVSQTNDTSTCESQRAKITVTINALPAAPLVTDTLVYCQNTTAAALTATGTKLKWYTAASGGSGDTTAPVPVTTTVGTTIYYVSQTTTTTGCEGPRAKIVVVVNTQPGLPTAVDTIAYCLNATAVALSATGTNLKWYTLASGGSGSTTAPVPPTGTVGYTTYYVTQSNSGTLCESARKPIVVRVKPLPVLPAVVSPVAYCAGATATALSATGTHLGWYADSLGGAASATAPTPSTGMAGVTYFYVSQTNDTSTCESQRAKITVTINALPAAPLVTDTVFYCQYTTAVALIATGTNLKWYTAASGGTADTAAPVPVTTTVGTTTYYVSQTIGSTGCEGPRSKIVVMVNVQPGLPTAVDTVAYCLNATASALSATGTNLKWYTLASGGSGSTTAPVPPTGTVGYTTYYVTQSNGGTLCESARKPVVVRIKPLPVLPGVAPVTYCAGATATALTATGVHLTWYTDSVGGSGSATAPVPSTASAGVTNYYVSQTNDTTGCEGLRAKIVVTINALPAAPVAADTVVYCQNAAAVALSAAGTNLKWYTVSSGGTSSATAPTPVTTTTGFTTYYVSQSSTSTGCEGPRKAIVVRIKSTPAAPVVTTPVTYCTGVTPSALTATGTSLKWYTLPSGGTSSTAPTPTTGSSGSTTFYVSQTDTTTGCEGPRASIVVTVNTTPDSPLVTTPVIYCQNATAVALAATGSSLKWYTAASGGTGSSTAPVPSTSSSGNTSYYVSQTSALGCESKRTRILVTVNALPAKPTVTTPVTYCQNATPVALTATGSSLLWYTASSGGSGSATAPTPTTTTAGTTTYYVTQTSSTTSCESQRASIDVVINPLPAAPAVTTPVNLCQGVTASALTATGTTLLWYTGATGGSGSSTAPVPPTISLGTTTYYVSQTSSLGCEGPRAAIDAVVNTIPAAPGVTTPIDLCIGVTPAALTATGINLKWYAAASGGTASASAPVPAVASTGSFNYYVSQTSNVGCESPRATIVTNVHPSPLLTITPIGAPDFVYCIGATVTIQANAPTATSYQWQRASLDLPGETADTLVTGANDYYGVRVTDMYGCKTTKAVFVFKDTLRKPDLAPTNVLMCNGVNIMLYCNPATAGYTYLWSKDGAPMGSTGTTTTAASMSETGSYSVVVTDYYGCTTTTNTSTISAYPGVPKPYITRTDNVLRLSNTYTSQQWYRNYVPVGSATGRSFTMLFDGTYYAQVFDANGCTDMSDTITVVALGIPEVNNPQQQVRLYPNPTQNKVYIETQIGIGHVSVRDVTGREVLSRQHETEIDMSNLADGMYLFMVTDKEGLLILQQKVHKLSQ